jgi:hypothetical protein
VVAATLATAGLLGPEQLVCSPSRPRGQRTRQRRPQLKLPHSLLFVVGPHDRIGKLNAEALAQWQCSNFPRSPLLSKFAGPAYSGMGLGNAKGRHAAYI